MPASPVVRRSPTRVAIGAAVNLLVMALHLTDLRALLRPELRPLVSSYFSDLAIPFAFYFLLCVIDDRVPRLQPATAKAGVAFLAAASAELLQGIGISALGRTFDPSDLGMYAAGVGLAVALDRLVPSRIVPAWPLASSATPGNFRPAAP